MHKVAIGAVVVVRGVESHHEPMEQGDTDERVPVGWRPSLLADRLRGFLFGCWSFDDGRQRQGHGMVVGRRRESGDQSMLYLPGEKKEPGVPRPTPNPKPTRPAARGLRLSRNEEPCLRATA